MYKMTIKFKDGSENNTVWGNNKEFLLCIIFIKFTDDTENKIKSVNIKEVR